ncbi:MAG: MliC family protein [Patescibacteria group bacterium]
MKKTIPIAISIAAIAILGLFIFTITRQQFKEKNKPIASAIFFCENNKNIEATFFKNKVELTLNDNRKMSLKQTISASGARYANKDESFVFWNKGDTAFINEGNALTYSNCDINKNNNNQETDKNINYKNTEYGFIFNLPNSWKNYSIVKEDWIANYFDSNSNQSDKTVSGPIIKIRHPEWTKESPRQDIPIMVFTVNQWDLLEKDTIHIGAAPINPAKIGMNSKYIFALPARYNFAFLTGFEEVEDIIKNNPLVDIEWEKVVNAINSCNAKSVLQTHNKLVTVTLKDNTKIEAFEPEIDNVMDITSNAIKTCGDITRITE